MAAYLLIGLPVFVLLIGIVLYNNLVGKKNNVEFALSSIDVMHKKRHDLIPNLIATVKQYMTHEKELLTQITELRNSVMKPGISEAEKMQAEQALSSMLGKVQVQVENYPELKSNTNFLQLQAALNEVEEQLSAARRAYNASVNDFNNGVEMFPSNIVAGMLGYKRKLSFEAAPAERANVDVGGLFDN